MRRDRWGTAQNAAAASRQLRGEEEAGTGSRGHAHQEPAPAYHRNQIIIRPASHHESMPIIQHTSSP